MVLAILALIGLLLFGSPSVADESNIRNAGRATFTSPATGITYRYGIAFLEEPTYPPDFTHFSYHNPKAPKGGRIRIGEMGNWDSFVETPATGLTVAGISFFDASRSLIYDRLLSRAIDTPTDRYGRLAEGVAIAEDDAWVAFKLRPGPVWHDGRPITTEDYVFSFDVYTTQSNPSIQQVMEGFESIEVLNDSEIRYWVKAEFRGDPSLVFRIGSAPLFPKHYWEANGRDISKVTLEPPLGSGPYRIKTFKTGRKITFERVTDYWGRDLPVNLGRYNFDTIVFDYFRDDQVLYEAVKGDLIDIREETVPVRWETGYDFPAVDKGIFIKELIKQLRPAGMWWPIFWNVGQERFQDVRVREALFLMQDGQWVNRVVAFDYFGYPTSFFHDSELAHRGTPSKLELELLEPLRDMVPPRVFTQEFVPTPHGGKGWNRENIKRALALFEEAGWVIRDYKLVNAQTGEPFGIRLLAVSPALGGSFIPYIQALKRVGIEATVSSPEISSWLHRSRTGDFDGGAIWFLPDNIPTSLIVDSFSSQSADAEYSYNWTRMRDPAVDKLIEAVVGSRTKERYVAAVRALDRVLMWNFYFLPTMSRIHLAMVYWDRYSFVPHGRLVRPEFYDAWWWDEGKAARTARILKGGDD
jgi:microcin C transport system substrate-binding protein